MLNDFLYFTRTERIGILILAVLALTLLLVPMVLPDRSEHNPNDFSALASSINERDQSFTEGNTSNVETQVERGITGTPMPINPNQVTKGELEALGLSAQSIRAWMSYLRKGGRFYNWEDITGFRALSDKERKQVQAYIIFPESATEKPKQVDEVIAPVLQAFDPNRVEEAQLLAMGIPQKAANNWLKFLSSGGHFKQATDIQKIYGLPEGTAEALLPYVQIAEISQIAQANPIAQDAREQPVVYETVNTNIIIDINKATAEEWQELRGIGPAYSNRIISFRDKLGGFVSVEQVAETYGLPDSVFQSVYLQLRPSSIFRPLAINRLGIAELAAHPYLSKANARIIVQYREEHGAYENAADLEKLYGLSEKVKKNITPYLLFEE